MRKLLHGPFFLHLTNASDFHQERTLWDNFKNWTAGMTGGIYRSIYNLDLSGAKSMIGPTINAIHRRINTSLAPHISQALRTSYLATAWTKLINSVPLNTSPENATTSHANAPAGCKTCLQITCYIPSAFLIEPMGEQGTRRDRHPAQWDARQKKIWHLEDWSREAVRAQIRWKFKAETAHTSCLPRLRGLSRTLAYCFAFPTPIILPTPSSCR